MYSLFVINFPVFVVNAVRVVERLSDVLFQYLCRRRVKLYRPSITIKFFVILLYN